ncbi:MAG: FAD:protein FMN transferase [Gemmataceae bacterium]
MCFRRSGADSFPCQTVRSALTLTALLVAAALLPGDPSSDPVRFEYQRRYMGTLARLVFYARSEQLARQAAEAAFERIAHLDRVMSDYREDSELSRLNRLAGTGPVPVSRDLLEVLVRAQEVARKSHGVFDVTCGPVVQLWRRARRQRQLPDPKRLQSALDAVDYRLLLVDPAHSSVELRKPGMRLDLGGIGKGYAADQAVGVLKKAGCPRALVALGGDIAIGDPPPGQQGWRILVWPLEGLAQVGIRESQPGADAADRAPQSESAPERASRRPLVISLANLGVSTSGDTEQFVEIDGRRYSHIVDPRTGIGVVARRSVTVIARDATASDSLATAVYVLGAAKGFEVLAAFGAEGYLVERLGDRLVVEKTRNWPAQVPAVLP